MERKQSFQTSGLKMPSRRNNAFVIALIVLNCITFVLMALFNAAASTRMFRKFKININYIKTLIIINHFKLDYLKILQVLFLLMCKHS